MKKRAGTLLGMVAVIVAGASLLSAPRPVATSNTGLLAGAHVPPAVRAILDRACRDCHSDETRYPWYSYVAPVSFLIRRDVQAGRNHLNLSRWPAYPLVRKERSLSEIANQVQDRGMPLPIYTLLHRDARLSQSEIDALFEWTQAERTRLILENTARPQ